MNICDIYIVEKSSTRNLLSTFNTFIKKTLSNSAAGYTYMSKDIKFDKENSLDLIIINDLMAQTLTSCHNKFIERKLVELNCAEAFDIYDLIPNMKLSYNELNSDQQFAFKMLRLIIQNKKILILQEQSNKISSELFNKTKNLLKNLSTNKGYTVILETSNLQNWSDICDRYVKVKNNKVSFIDNKLKHDSVLDSIDEVYQLAL